jgi:hypothetical protein
MKPEGSKDKNHARGPLFRRLIIAFLLLAIGLLIFRVYWAKTAGVYHPTRMDFTKIKDGMTESEVEAILGPPHEVRTNGRDVVVTVGHTQFSRVYHKRLIYYGASDENGKSIIINVDVDDEGRVLTAGISTRPSRSVLQTIMEWLQ